MLFTSNPLFSFVSYVLLGVKIVCMEENMKAKIRRVFTIFAQS